MSLLAEITDVLGGTDKACRRKKPKVAKQEERSDLDQVHFDLVAAAMMVRQLATEAEQAGDAEMAQGLGDVADKTKAAYEALSALRTRTGKVAKQDEDVLAELKLAFPDAEIAMAGAGRYGEWGDAGGFTAAGVEYNWIRNEEEAEKIAGHLVERDLNEEPEIFDQDWLRGFIEIRPTDQRIIAGEEADNYVDLLADEQILKDADMQDEYDEAGDDDKEAVLERAKEKVRDDRADEIERKMEDPLEYFCHEEGTYTPEELMKQTFIRIDIPAATESAVQTDGWAHFLSLYDGNYETTPGGVIYFRE